MAGIMLDSVNPDAIIDAVRRKLTWRNMQIIAGAGYVDGAVSKWPDAKFAELKATGVRVVTITALGGPAMIADVETGDLTPESAAEWAAGRKQAGARLPVLYVNRGNKPAVIRECLARGLHLERDYGLGVATLDGTFTDRDGTDLRDQPGVLYVQCYGAKQAGIQADVSVVTRAGNAWLDPAEGWKVQALHDLNRASGALLDAHKLLRAHQ